MVNLNTSLFTGFSGVQAAQNGLNITGNNIANVNTPGYSRQRADIISRGIITSAGITHGHGADVRSVMSLRDNLANQFLTEQEGRHAYQQQLAAGLNEMEGIIAETDQTGIAQSMQQFFDTLERATLRPADIGTRQELLGVAEKMTSEIHIRDSNLTDHQNLTNNDLADLVEQVNDITARIDDLNRKIASAVQPAHNLIDDRYAEINKLSKIVGVETFELDNRMVQVNLAGPNVILVGRELRNELGVSPNSANSGFYDITHKTKGSTTVVTDQIVSGEIGAKVRLRDEEIQGFRDDLDALAAGMIIAFNNVHDAGFDLNGNTNLRFFDPLNSAVLGPNPVGTQDPTRYQGMAANISLSSQLIDPLNPGAGYDPSRIALSGSGAEGNNENGLALTQLKHTAGLIDLDRDGDATNDGSETFQEFYGGVLSGMGRTVRNANDGLDTQIALLEQAQVRREQVSGVSLDEEAIQLSQFQRAFEASSRFLNVINQLSAEILNRLG